MLASKTFGAVELIITARGAWEVGMFDHILLQAEQEELLITLVEAVRAVPRESRVAFYVSRASGGDHLLHPGVPTSKREIYYGDVEILAGQGLLNLGFGSHDSPHFDVTPLGFRYYEHLKESLGQPVERVEKSAIMYINADQFRSRFATAYEKWAEAEALLWRTDSNDQATTIGHLCRESMQAFATKLLDVFPAEGADVDPAHAISRIRSVLAVRVKSKSSKGYTLAGALVDYWGCLSDLIQRQEHGALKEGDELVWEDARRIVFNTAMAMFETAAVLA
jgi:hypothetical protein